LHDRDNTGKLSADMFIRCLQIASMNATGREIELLISEMDPKETGVIEYDEFVNCCFLSYLFKKEYKLRLLFEECDKEKKGIITLSTLRVIL
jgi:Ca2+-binding EF-hand superfamily protein